MAPMSDYASRFSAIARLYGISGLATLRASRVAVIGLGGVGSWAVEALARSGVGHLTLVDFDEVCVSNVNRQIHALDGTVGRPKAEVLAARCRAINPEITLDARIQFFTTRTLEPLLAPPPDLVVDAIDDVRNKCLLLNACVQRGLPVVTSGGAGGRRDPARIELDDLSRSYNDPLLIRVRKRLRQEYGFAALKNKRWGIPCVFSPEKPVFPQSDGSVCDTPEAGSDLRLNCESGFGTATFVTGTMGFRLAAVALDRLLEKQA
jgi:tRNA A37 threonylcarbamoyladenosine dehydratase